MRGGVVILIGKVQVFSRIPPQYLIDSLLNMKLK